MVLRRWGSETLSLELKQFVKIPEQLGIQIFLSKSIDVLVCKLKFFFS